MAVEVSNSNHVHYGTSIYATCNIYLARIRALNILQQIYDTRICPWCISDAEVVVSEPHVYIDAATFSDAFYICHNMVLPHLTDYVIYIPSRIPPPKMVLPHPPTPTLPGLRNFVRSELAALRRSPVTFVRTLA